jgi:hypothetical protein
VHFRPAIHKCVLTFRPLFHCYTNTFTTFCHHNTLDISLSELNDFTCFKTVAAPSKFPVEALSLKITMANSHASRRLRLTFTNVNHVGAEVLMIFDG